MALLLVAGCSGEDGAGPAAPDPAPGSGSEPSTAAPSGAEGDGADAAATPATPAGEVPAEPVAAVPGVVEGMVLEVYRLARTDDTATVTMAARNEGAERLPVLNLFEGEVNDFDAGGVSLLDPVGLDRYLVLRDTEDECLCSSFRAAPNVEPGARAYFSASFPAPPAEVTSVTVETPSGSLVDVPITEGS